ncbi:MAG: DUF4230 domain-containing protein [Spirochaetaceae bacterium]
MKLTTTVTITLTLTLLAAAAGFLFLPPLRGLLIEEERTFSSRELLAEMNDILDLQTVEYVYRMVFPHDFYTPGLTLEGIFDRLAGESGTPEEILTDEELAFLRAYNLAWDIGFPTTPQGESFVVVTARVRAGYDLSGELEGVFRLEPLDPQTSFPESLPPEESRVIVSLPRASVVDVVLEDLSSENYPYPPARVDAQEWREISSLAGEVATRRTIREGILEEAQEQARRFIGALLTEAGFGDIRFNEG